MYLHSHTRYYKKNHDKNVELSPSISDRSGSRDEALICRRNVKFLFDDYIKKLLIMV